MKERLKTDYKCWKLFRKIPLTRLYWHYLKQLIANYCIFSRQLYEKLFRQTFQIGCNVAPQTFAPETRRLLSIPRDKWSRYSFLSSLLEASYHCRMSLAGSHTWFAKFFGDSKSDAFALLCHKFWSKNSILICTNFKEVETRLGCMAERLKLRRQHNKFKRDKWKRNN